MQSIYRGLALWLFVPCLALAESPWKAVSTGTEASLRGLAAVSERVAWASGTQGTILRTLDGGVSWVRRPVEGAEELDFRDIEAFDRDTALFLTAGQPARIYRTEDGGASFTLVHESPHQAAFFDGMDFWDDQRGLVYSDPVDGRFLVLATDDGGKTWKEASGFPDPVEGEAGFAASGSNVAVVTGGHAWIGTGGAVARVLRSSDGGETWAVAPTPLRQGEPSAGIFSIVFRDPKHGLVVGGDYRDPENPEGNIARSDDGGQTWQTIPGPPPRGHRAAVGWWPQASAWLAIGRAGTDFSEDDGRSWKPLSDVGFYTLSIAEDGTVWVAGSEGRAARLKVDDLPSRESQSAPEENPVGGAPESR